jgi:thiamine pyrophosphate-dependent acetolactate synthase large subunit-like protein
LVAVNDLAKSLAPDFLMNGQELANAMQYGLGNPDFAQYARAFGAHGEVVSQTTEFAPALEWALNAQVPALLELRINPDAITPRITLGAIRAAHLKPGPVV